MCLARVQVFYIAHPPCVCSSISGAASLTAREPATFDALGILDDSNIVINTGLHNENAKRELSSPRISRQNRQ